MARPGPKTFSSGGPAGPSDRHRPDGTYLGRLADMLGLHGPATAGDGPRLLEAGWSGEQAVLRLVLGSGEGHVVTVEERRPSTPAYARARHLVVAYRGSGAPGTLRELLAEMAVHLGDARIEDLQAVLPRTEVRMVPDERDPLYRDLPALRCLAPWTTLTALDHVGRSVPCAPAWLDSALTEAEVAAELEEPPELVRQRDREHRLRYGRPWLHPASEATTLPALWNGPLFRQMRRTMSAPAGTPRCHPSCRVLLGVETRGLTHFDRPDHDLAPAVVANRQLLAEEIRERRAVLQASPLELGIDVAARCNIACGFCGGPQGAIGDLTPSRYEQVVAWLPALMQLVVAGPGEPLTSPALRQLLDLLDAGDYPSLLLSLTTNGTLLTPAWLGRHRGVSWGQIRISLNAGSAETYRKATGTDLFGRLLENVEAVAALRDVGRCPLRLVLSCVLSRHVLGDLERFAETVHRFGASAVLEPMTGNARRLSPFTSPDLTRQLADECQAVATAFERRNPGVSAAFRGASRFCEQRLREGDLRPLPRS